MEEKITELVNLVSDNPKFSLHLRLLWITETEIIRIYYGRCSTSVYAKDYGFTKDLTYSSIPGETRGKVLALFSKLEFLVNELIQFKLLGFNAPNGEKLDDLLAEVTFDRKIGLLKEWGFIDKELRGKIKKITDLRNDLAHEYDIRGVFYPHDKKQDERFKLKKVFDKFKNDIEIVWKSLIALYQEKQHAFGGELDALIKNIREHSFETSERTTTSI